MITVHIYCFTMRRWKMRVEDHRDVYPVLKLVAFATIIRLCPRTTRTRLSHPGAIILKPSPLCEGGGMKRVRAQKVELAHSFSLNRDRSQALAK
jgi:hypothetical protein